MYPLIDDMHSKISLVHKLLASGTGTSCVIAKLKEMFAEHECPHTDNESQHASAAFADFATAWHFKHATSSPQHTTLNGFDESVVKITRQVCW